MRKNHRAAGYVPSRPWSCENRCGSAHLHAHPLHLGDHLAAEGGEPAVVVLAAATDPVVAVVGEQHPAHAEVVVQLDQARLVGDRVAALDVETDTPGASGSCALDVVERLRSAGTRRAAQQPVAHRGRASAGGFLDALLAEADIEPITASTPAAR